MNTLIPTSQGSQHLQKRKTAGLAGPESRARRWTLRIVASLMILQASGLTFLSVVYLSQLNWIRERAFTGLTPSAVDTLLFSVLSIPLAFFAARAVWGLMRLQRVAWLQAMIIQALLLVFALTSYSIGEGNALTYWTLLSCIIIVLYLNTHEIRASFHADAATPNDPTELFGDETGNGTSEADEASEADGVAKLAEDVAELEDTTELDDAVGEDPHTSARSTTQADEDGPTR